MTLNNPLGILNAFFALLVALWLSLSLAITSVLNTNPRASVLAPVGQNADVMEALGPGLTETASDLFLRVHHRGNDFNYDGHFFDTTTDLTVQWLKDYANIQWQSGNEDLAIGTLGGMGNTLFGEDVFMPTIGGMGKIAQVRLINGKPVLVNGTNGEKINLGAIQNVNKDGAPNRPLWGSWNDYSKVTVNGRQYAQVGDKLYTRHAVDSMQPSGLGAHAGNVNPGRSIAPGYVDDVISQGNYTTKTVNDEVRRHYQSGSTLVVTSNDGRTVISINPYRFD